MEKKIKFTLALPVLLCAVGAMTLSACGGNEEINKATGSNSQALFTITFNPCVGDDSKITTQTIGYEKTLDSFPQPSAEDAPAGKEFAGWSTKYKKSAKSGDPDHIVEAKNFKVTSNVVLYAVWKKGQSYNTEYMNRMKEVSKDNHLYYHYLRFDNSAESYAPWDVWAWAYKPDAGEGVKIDWVGRTQSEDHLSATGDAVFDEAGAYVDIDLAATYDGGWNAVTKTMGGSPATFVGATEIGLQIVQSESRINGKGFWTNDSSNLYIKLEDYALDLPDGGTAYHVFVVESYVQSPTTSPQTDVEDPFENDDGTNVTYGNPAYNNINWGSTAEKVSTAEDFLDLGVGYQIMVSSFADSDGDGSGDIYGIEKKLDYIANLGVKALWLTPIQLSDSYHGYDITNYEVVDPKFGSAVSPAALENGGVVTSETAMADYASLIEKAHAKGMKVVMDLVLNHTSTSNQWFVQSANLDDEYRAYYQWGNHNTQAIIKEDNYWYPYGDHDYSFYAKFGSAMPELNFSYKTTREAVEEMSAFWAKDVGVDGFRLDAVKHIYMSDEVASTAGDTIVHDIGTTGNYSSDLTKNLHFFRELKKSVKDLSGKNVFFVGENFDGHAYHVAPYYEAFDSMFDFYSYYNLTSSAATGRTGSTSAFGTAQGFLGGTSLYTVAQDNLPGKGIGDASGHNLGTDPHGDFAKANNSAWNFGAVYDTYNKYRGDTSLPGLFTSNHDIARVINRIAGTGTSDGLQAQGNVGTDNYASLEESANCVKIAELMFPGLTWIYYGDEIGMTGNFPAGKDAESAYADLWYRQPMKWGDDYTTSYYVTGSGVQVGWDEVNASSAVVPAMQQASNANSQYGILSTFAKLKSGAQYGPVLSRGSFHAENYSHGNLAANTLAFSRTYNGTTIKVLVNFNNQTMPAYGLEGTVLASYNGGTQSSMPAYSAIVVKA